MMDGVLYASTNTALMKSADLGQSWSQVRHHQLCHAVVGIGGRIVALTTFGARYSIDNGVTWVNSTNYPVDKLHRPGRNCWPTIRSSLDHQIGA